MAKQTRETLREYFREGSIPTETNFSDLIDSMVNIRSDGIHRTDSDGLHVVSTAERGRLVSFFRRDDPDNPVWSTDMDPNGGAVRIRYHDDAAAGTAERMVITADGRVGIGTGTPAAALEVNGAICSGGRVGTFSGADGPEPVHADGEWHVVLRDLRGCTAFEIVAGVGREGTGKYAIMHAVVVNAFGRRGKIRYTQSVYLSRNDAMRLKWRGDQNGYALYLRTLSDYGKRGDGGSICVNCAITRLWFDEQMKGCVQRIP